MRVLAVLASMWDMSGVTVFGWVRRLPQTSNLSTSMALQLRDTDRRFQCPRSPQVDTVRHSLQPGYLTVIASLVSCTMRLSRPSTCIPAVKVYYTKIPLSRVGSGEVIASLQIFINKILQEYNDRFVPAASCSHTFDLEGSTSTVLAVLLISC